MKMKKILLPLATVASTAAVVTPIITSCNGGSVNGQELFDGLYKRSNSTILAADSWAEEDATKNYINAMANNHDLFGADCFEGLSSYILQIFKNLEPEGINRIAKVKGSCGLDTVKTNVDKNEISAKLTLDLTATDIMQEVSDIAYKTMFRDATISINGSLELDNLKIKVVKFGDKIQNGLNDYIWGLKFNYEYPENETDYDTILGDTVVKSNLSISIANLVGISTKLHFNFDIDKTNDDYMVKTYLVGILSLFSSATGLPLGSLQNITVKEGK